nr:hypothetical protein 23 [Balneolaceae bacterium]
MNNNSQSTPNKSKHDPLVEELFNLTAKQGKQASSTTSGQKDDLEAPQGGNRDPLVDQLYRVTPKATPPPVQDDPDESFLTNFGEGFEQGRRSLVAGGATLLGEAAGLFDEDSEESIKQWAIEHQEQAPPPDDSWGQWIGSLVPSILPTAAAIAAAPFTGGSSLLPMTVVGGLSASAAGSGIMEYDAYKKRKGEEPNEWERLAVAAAYGGFEFAFERFALSKYLPEGFGPAKLFRSSVPDAAKAGQHLVAEFAKRNPSRAKKIFKMIRKGMSVEGFEEAGTEIGQQMTSILYEDDEDFRKRLEQLPQNVLNAYAGGALMGAALGPLSFASQSKVHRDRRKAAGGVTLVRNRETGEPLELVQPQGKTEDGELIFQAMDYDGEMKTVRESQIDQAQTLTLEQFDLLLQDRLDATQFEITQREPVRIATFNNQEVQIIGEDGEGGFFIQLPDGSQRQANPEELEDIIEIDPVTQVDAERQRDGQPMASEQLAQAEALRNTREGQDPALPLFHPEHGDIVLPGTPEHAEALELIKAQQQQRLQEDEQAAQAPEDEQGQPTEPKEVIVGKGNKKQRVRMVPNQDGGFDVESSTSVQSGETIEQPVSNMTAAEAQDLRDTLQKDFDARFQGQEGQGFTVETELSDPEDPFSSPVLRVIPKGQTDQRGDQDLQEQEQDGPQETLGESQEDVGQDAQTQSQQNEDLTDETRNQREAESQEQQGTQSQTETEQEDRRRADDRGQEEPAEGEPVPGQEPEQGDLQGEPQREEDVNIFEEQEDTGPQGEIPQVGNFNEAFEDAPKVLGDRETFTLPNGEQHEVQYAVVEAESILPSHNPINFNQTEGFPTLPDGTTPNDNDYQNSKEARDRVADIAQNMDERIFQDTPIISEEGIVVSGNNRTMSTQRNIRQDSPRADWYREEVQQRAHRYGIDPEQVQPLQNPMLVRIDYDVEDYSTETFKAYNESEKKQKSDVEKAVVVSKSITDRTVDALVDAIEPEQNGTIRAALNSPRIARKAISVLEDAGIISQNEKAIYYDARSQTVTSRGRDLIELVAKGAILNSEALRNSDVAGVKAFSNKITFALPALLEIKALGPEFDLSQVISGAVNLQRQIVEQGITPRDIYAQQSLFEGEDIPPSVKFIHYLIDSGRDRFKDAIKIYARSARSGGQDMFNTEPRTRPEIFNDLFDHAQKQANREQREIIQGIRSAQSPNERRGSDQQRQGRRESSEDDTADRQEQDSGQQQVEPEDRPGWGETNTTFTKDQATKDLETLRNKLNNLNVGLDPEMLSAGIRLAGFHIEAGARRFGQFAKIMIDELGEGIKPYLKSFYNGVRDYPGFDNEGMDSYQQVSEITVDEAIAQEQQNETDDGRPTTDNLEPDSPRAETQQRMGEEDVQPGRESDRPGAQQDLQTAQGEARASDSQRDNDGAADVPGEQGDTSVPESAQRPGPDAGTSGSSRQDIRSRIRGQGEAAQQQSETTAGRAAENLPTETNDLSFDEKLALQRQADALPVRFNDEQNIRQTLPVLFDQQKGDVVKAEKRFFGEDPGKGMMFTNGTGTGKTYTGLGIIKRFFNAGKQDILIVVPSDRKVQDWIEDGQNLGLMINQLADTSDAGQGISITTYANFRDNQAVAGREFDLVVYDESHKLMSNQEGEITASADAHFHTANVPSYAKDRAAENIVGPKPRVSDDMNDQAKEAALKKLNEWRKRAEENKDEIEAEIERLVNKTKVVFLSATPFSYHKNLKYADGILFNITEGKQQRHSGYNQGDHYDTFFIQNFGYRMRYNKLTLPEAEVNVGLMERRFHEKMKEEGVASNRRLDLDQDYSRDFVLVDSRLGKQIDAGIKAIQEDDQLRALRKPFRRKMNWIRTSQLLESIKAQKMTERAREHLDLGRKVVVFHNYKTQQPDHPFRFQKAGPPAPERNYVDPEVEQYNLAVDHWYDNYEKYPNLNLSGLSNPVDIFQEAFGENMVGVFNGDIPNRLRSDYIERFNADNFDQPILVVQVDAGKEGISMHDTTGQYPRVLINLGLPIKPTDAIQMEGRIYRIGQQSNAIFEYPILKTNFEMRQYAQKIQERVRTPENLALGDDARNLELAFKQGYEQPLFGSPTEDQGTGGKQMDNSFDEMSDFEKAKTWFFGRQKKTAKTKSQEGTDYFATPEPLGLKMVEWLRPRPNESLLEPSAGHGAIARYLPDDTKNKVIEPSYELFSELSLNANGDAINDRFENHHIVNKYDGIVMNPPYGTGGKTAMQHLAKATRHLRNGGRVIAIIPDGPAMDKRMDKWFQGEDAENMYLTGEISLPGVTFSRAGTQVSTRIVVLDKFEGDNPSQRLASPTTRDLSGIESFEELFDRLELMEMPARVELTEEEAPQRVPEKDPDSIFEIVEGEHTRDKYPIWTVTMDEFLDRNRFTALKKVALLNDGYYSSYNKGDAVRGFIFKQPENAQRFVEQSESVLANDIPHDLVEKHIQRNEDDFRFQRLKGPAGRQFAREQLQQQLEEAQRELQAAQRALDNKQRELNRRLQEDQENLFGERQSTQTNKLFDMRADASQVNKALKPFTDRFEVARRKVNRLAKRLEQLPDRPDPTLFDQPDASLQRIDTTTGQPDVYPADNIRPVSERARTIRQDLEEITQDWAQRDKVVIAEHPDLLPQYIKERLAKEDGRIGGLFSGGKAYVLTYNLNSTDEGLRALAHEAIGHMGIRGLLEYNSRNREDYLQRYEDLTDEIYQSFKDDPLFKQLVERYDFDLRRTNHRQQAAEEFVAHIAESKTAPGIIDKVINFINDLLRNMGLNTRLTRSDVARMLADARRYVEGSQETVFFGGTIMPVFKKNPLAPQFYSKLHNTVAQKLNNRGTAEQFISTLQSWNRKGEFKTEELEWSGVIEWLETQKDRPDKVTKDEVLEFLAENQVQVHEIRKEDQKPEPAEAPSAVDQNAFNSFLSEYDMSLQEDMNGEIFFVDSRTNVIPEFEETRDLIEQRGGPQALQEFDSMADRFQEFFSGELEIVPPGSTKYGRYTLPGGRGYKEFLLTLPQSRRSEADAITGPAMAEGRDLTPEETERLNEIREEARSRQEFTSSHFDEPNIVAHVRFNERTDSKGRRVLFLEEIQSDWHQAGRKKGYKGEPLKYGDRIEGYTPVGYEFQTTTREGVDYVIHQLVRQSDGEVVAEDMTKTEALAKSGLAPSVPDAPFKNTWHELVIKRMIRYAAENDFDMVGWTPGEVQAERYDLSNYIDKIEYSSATNILRAWDGRSEVITERNITPEQLPDYIGKEAAEKLINEHKQWDAEGGGSVYMMEGEQLSVGGEGMKAFYNKIVPNFVSSYIKKWDSKIEVAEMQAGSESDAALQSEWPNGDISQDEAFDAFHDGAPVFVEIHIDEVNSETYEIIGESDIDRYISRDPGAEFFIEWSDNEIVKNQQFLAFPVTNKMFQSVLDEGQPLFKRFETMRETPHKYQKRFDNFLREYQDRLVDFKRIIEGFREEGRQVGDRSDVYTEETLAMGRSDDQIREFRQTMVDPLIDYLNNLYRNHDLTYEDVRRYLIARHAPERNEMMRQKNPDAPQLTEVGGQPIDQVMAEMEERGLTGVLEEVGRRIKEINEFIIDKRVESGLMSTERAEALREMYEHYVPFRGFAEHMDIDPTVYSGDIEAKGRSSDPGDVLAYLMAMGETAIVAGEKNKVKQTLLNFVRENYDRSDMFRIKNVYYRKTEDTDPDTGKQLWEVSLAKPSSQELLEGTVKRSLDPDFQQGVWSDRETQVRVMVDGRPFVIEFRDPQFATAINNLAVDRIPKVLSHVNNYTRILKGLITQYSPEFGLRNLIRDSTTGGINLTIDFDAATAAKIVNPVTMGKAMGALRRALVKGEWDGEWGQAARNFMKDGSMTGFWQLDTVRDRTRALQEQIEKGSFFENPLVHSKDKLKALADFVDDYNRVIENTIRLATYKHLIDNNVTNRSTGKPYTRKQAANYAKNLTVNFNRRGNEATTIGSLFIFFNAAVQGMARQAMPFFSTDTRTRWRAAAAPVVMGATAYAFIEAMRFGMGKDEDDEYYYDKINEYTRTHNIILPNLLSEDPEDYLRIPLPYGYNVYWAAGDAFNRLVYEAAEPEDIALQMAVTTIDAYNPIGSATGENAFESAVKTFTPTVLQPGFEIATNTDFAGNPIKPEPFPFAVEEPQSQQYFRYVSDWALKTSKYLNRVSGGDEVTSGFIDVSPEHIEYVSNYFGGGVAKFFSNIWNSGEHVYDAYNDLEPLALEDIYDVPFARSFYGKVSRAATRDDFIEHEETINRLMHQHTEYMERGDLAKARQHLARNRHIMALEPELKSIKRQMRSLRAYQKQLSGTDTKKSRELNEKINQSVHQLYLAFNKRYNQVVRQAEEQPRRASDFIDQ